MKINYKLQITNYVVLLCLLVGGISVSCNSDDDSTTQWRKKNETAYNEVKANTEYWTPLFDENDKSGWPQGVYYHDMNKNDITVVKGDEHPLQTAKVRVNYRGYYLNDPDNTFDKGGEADFLVDEAVRGFSVALQQMVEGDKWKICIPYHLGYGVTYYSSSGIQSYSTLFFEVELLKIVDQYPK